jgi:2-polyprenyl-3-methyl-5-hydroxy-6-metoxy-1,4-benzoquinol methylase
MAWSWRRLRARITAPEDDAYDDSFWAFHEAGDWAGFARVVCERFSPNSIADVGCGQGLALEALQARDPHLRLIGYDGSRAALRRAESRGVPVRALDLATASEDVIRSVAGELTTFDLVLCLEVAEHLPPWRARTLVRLLTAAPRVVFSAAHPNQGGRLHVNEQPAAYWVRRFGEQRFRVSPVDAAFRAEVAELSLPSWYAENLHVFERARVGEVRS